MKNKSSNPSFEHGLSRAKASRLEEEGKSAVESFFAELKSSFPYRRLNPTERVLVEKYNICYEL
jgi:hypothetical protein